MLQYPSLKAFLIQTHDDSLHLQDNNETCQVYNSFWSKTLDTVDLDIIMISSLLKVPMCF